MKILILLLVFPAFVMAQGFGIVTLVKGSPIVQDSQGSQKPLSKGDKVFESDTIITSANSLVRLVMMDTNVIDIYPNSKLLIKEYIYKPKENQKNVNLEVSEGRIKSTVKQKYDNEKNKFTVKTPVIVAGVRGTIFSTRHELKTGLSEVVTQEGNVMVGRLDANQQVKEFFSVSANHKIEIKDKQVDQPRVLEVPKADIDKQKAEDKSVGFSKFGKEKRSNSDEISEAASGKTPEIETRSGKEALSGSGASVGGPTGGDRDKKPDSLKRDDDKKSGSGSKQGDRQKQERSKQERSKQERSKQERSKQEDRSDSRSSNKDREKDREKDKDKDKGKGKDKDKGKN